MTVSCNLIFALLAMLCWPLPALADPLPLRPLVIGCNPDFPPYEFVMLSGEPAGLNVDLSRAIAEVMGVEVEFRYVPWDEARRQLAAGRLDILEGVSDSGAGNTEFDFAPPHSQIYQALWVRNDARYHALSDLSGQQVLVVRGREMQHFLAQRPELRIESIAVDSLEDALRLLAIGRYAAALGAKLPGEYLLGRLQVESLRPIARPLLAEEYGFAVKKGNKEMLALVTEGLALLKQSGQYRQIYNKWLGPLPAPEGISRSHIIRLGGMILGPLLLAMTLVLLWSWTLKRQVRRRTADLKLEVAERERAMGELERHQQQLIQADKMTSLGVLVSGVAHEINNPNALLLLNLPQLQRAWVDIAPLLDERLEDRGDFSVGRLPYSQMRSEIPEMLGEMQASAGRIKRIVVDLKDFARRDDSPVSTLVDLNQVVEAALRLVENPLKNATDHFSLQLDKSLPLIGGNGQRIEQVVINLLLNACQALNDPAQPIVLRTLMGTEEVRLEVEDGGCGVAPEHLAQLTDPFFTTRRESGGTGLGLSVSAGIAHEHGGRLEFSSTPGQGTLARLILPRKS
ncbi:MAG: transporter substrate-binding domain-containing protein [Desulfuromonadaceae bacterium]|nr:transporter substrate-binding domain-containing protein [Desulfuromonadaceae bacterium]